MKFRSKSPPSAFTNVELSLAGILLIYPVLLFLIRGGMNGALFLIAAISLTLHITRHKRGNKSGDNTAIAFSFAMFSGLLVIMISQVYHHDVNLRYFDSAARFLLAVPILLALREINMRVLTVIQYSIPLGAIAALVAILMNDPTVRYNASTFFMNHIHLGDMALLLGFLSILSIDWIDRDRSTVKLLKMAGLISGLLVSGLSSARGGWIAIPVFVFAFIYSRTKENFIRKVVLALLFSGAIAFMGYLFIEPIHYRLWMIYSDLTSFTTGNIDTSIGVRLQLWKAAFHLIAENPILGVGADGFGKAMDVLSASGFITPIAAELGKGEVHNEILAQTVRFGILGLISILSIYFVPFYIFLRAAKSGSKEKSVAAMMGMCVTLGFLIFGFTVETFDLKMTAAFYSLTVAVLLAIAIHRLDRNETDLADVPRK